MATKSADKIFVGAATISVGDYTSGGGAATLVDVGYLDSAAILTDATENFEVETENTQGILRAIPTKKDPTLQVVMSQAELDNLMLALRQPSSNKTGSSPDETLVVDGEQEVYKQIQLVTKGGGTNGTRTITFWKCAVSARGAINFAKGDKQLVDVTFKICEDDSIDAGSGRFYKIAES